MLTKEAIAWLALSLTCTTQSAYVDPWENQALGVEGFPDCQRKHPDQKFSQFFAEIDLTCPPKGEKADVRIACVGDSITAGAHATDGSHAYPGQLQKLLDVAHGAGRFSVTNLGATGRTLDPHTDTPYNVTPQFKALARGDWDVIIIMLGTNDGKKLVPQCEGAVDDFWQCPIAAHFKSFIEVCAKLGKAGRVPSIYVVVPPPLMLDMYAGIHASVVNSVLPAIIPRFASQSLHVTESIDVFTQMGGTNAWSSLFPREGCTHSSNIPSCLWFCDSQSCDQCHLNNYGYKHLAARIHSALKKEDGGLGMARASPLLFDL